MIVGESEERLPKLDAHRYLTTYALIEINRYFWNCRKRKRYDDTEKATEAQRSWPLCKTSGNAVILSKRLRDGLTVEKK